MPLAGVARDLARASCPTLPASARATVDAGAAAVERILAKGEPVYGVNTGVGKLAGVPIERANPGEAAAQCCVLHTPPA